MQKVNLLTRFVKFVSKKNYNNFWFVINWCHCEHIFQQSLYKTGRLQSRFQRMGIRVCMNLSTSFPKIFGDLEKKVTNKIFPIITQAQAPRPVSAPEFQFCLNYTLLAKLAPSWNKVGEYLVQGVKIQCHHVTFPIWTPKINVNVCIIHR